MRGDAERGGVLRQLAQRRHATKRFQATGRLIIRAYDPDQGLVVVLCGRADLRGRERRGRREPAGEGGPALDPSWWSASATGVLLLNVSAPSVTLPAVGRDLEGRPERAPVGAQRLLSWALAATLLTAGTLPTWWGGGACLFGGLAGFAAASVLPVPWRPRRWS